MVVRRRPVGRCPSTVDGCRLMTDDTWVLVAIYIDEEHLTWREIADRLNRDPEDFAARMREGIRAGKLDETRRHLEAWGGLYARRTQRVHREAVM